MRSTIQQRVPSHRIKRHRMQRRTRLMQMPAQFLIEHFSHPVGNFLVEDIYGRSVGIVRGGRFDAIILLFCGR